MTQVNEHYLKLQTGYLFPEIGRRVQAFNKAHPEARLIRLGIGDVVLPLPAAAIAAFHAGVDELASVTTFHGYGPEQGYDFLIEAIIAHEYRTRGVALDKGEIFISDGSKCDTGNIQEIFSLRSKVAVTDPAYPVYVDTTVMGGREILYLPSVAENSFSPSLPKEKADLVYLCSPNNPTGTALTREALARWVAYAQEQRAVILFDAAYEAFITKDHLPHSIYEIEEAKEVAIEFRSFSKTAGFTGTRCAYAVIPETLRGFDDAGNAVSLNRLWYRRHTTKFNGVSYPVQRAAAACFTPEGKKQVARNIAYYLGNAQLIREGLGSVGLSVYGGINAPYLWIRLPKGIDSWGFFDKLLAECHVVGTPGAGFGPSGEGYFRLSAFGFTEQIEEAVARITKQLRL